MGKNILFPINRSITGKGIIKTLKIFKKDQPKLNIKYYKSGKRVFDWIIPSEWNVKNAYVLDQEGNKIIDFKKNNLHLIGYSVPVNKKVSKQELLDRLFSSKKIKDAIPYITSYYKKNWGFCVSKNYKNEINKKYKKGERFKVFIDSNFKINGNMPIGEYVIRGNSQQEILISTYICHPSMANNELSGPLLSMMLINHFKKYKLNKTLRFIFVPETIGSIAYINQNKKN